MLILDETSWSKNSNKFGHNEETVVPKRMASLVEMLFHSKYFIVSKMLIDSIQINYGFGSN